MDLAQLGDNDEIMIRDKFKKIVGKNLKYYRKKLGFTKYMLAKESGVKITTICDIEKGKYSSQFYTIYSLASVLGISLDDLVKNTTSIIGT